jgi:hypothetical protein
LAAASFTNLPLPGKPDFQAIFRVKIALESLISGIRSSLLFRDRRCRLGEPWIRGTMPQLNP